MPVNIVFAANLQQSYVKRIFSLCPFVRSLGRKIGLTPQSTYNRIRSLEERFDVKYVVAIDTEKLGYQRYIAFVKFESDKPSTSEIRDALINESRVQLVAKTAGIYDLIIFFLAENSNALSSFIGDVRAKPPFSKFDAKWYVTPIWESYGFVPLRDEFFELLKGKVWKRKKESPRPMLGQLLTREFNVLRALNKNSAIDFKKIDEEYKMNKGNAQYSYHKLTREGLLQRLTINLQNTNLRYNAIILMDISNYEEFNATKKEFLEFVLNEKKRPINKFAYVSDYEIPDGVIFIAPIMTDSDLRELEDEFQSKVKGISLNTLVSTEVIIGKLCYRKFDNTKSKQKRAIEEYQQRKTQL